MMLTHLQISSSKPAEKPFKLHDAKGMHLAVQPNGSKLVIAHGVGKKGLARRLEI